MSEIVAAIAGALVTACLAWLVYSYRNKIVYSITGIGSNVTITGGDIVPTTSPAARKTITSQRLILTNRGFRTLSNVELHWPLSDMPVVTNVSNTSGLSRAAVKTHFEEKILRIAIDTLPRNEEITIDTLSVGYGEWPGRELRGTGGSYQVIRKTLYESNRAMWSATGWGAASVIWIIFYIVVPAVTHAR